MSGRCNYKRWSEPAIGFLIFQKKIQLYLEESTLEYAELHEELQLSDMSFDKMQKLVNNQRKIVITVMTYQKTVIPRVIQHILMCSPLNTAEILFGK